MSFKAPVVEQRYLLDVIARMNCLAVSPVFADATPDLVDAILEGAAQLAEGEFAPLNRSGDLVGARWTPDGVIMPDGFKAAYRAYVDGGWGSISVPVEHGGQGLPFSIGVAVFEDICSANMAFSLIMMLTFGAVEALAAHGSPEQQRIWLPRLVSGEWNGTMNLTEPQAGSDVGALKTQAERQPDGSYRIKGAKIFITFGEHDLTDNIVHLVLARTPEAPTGTKGVSLFLVPKYRLDPAGFRAQFNDVRCVSIEHKLGIHASPTCTLSYGDDDSCVGYLVGQECGGMRGMFTMMNNARLHVGLQGVAVAERAMQQAVAFARDRFQSPRAGRASRDPVRIVEHPDVRRMLMMMRALTQGARALVYYAAGLVDRAHLGDGRAAARLDLLTPLAKAYGTDIGVEVASLGLQVHGGMGYIEETGAAQHYRDARIAPIYEGTNGIQAADLVSRKLPLDGGQVFADLISDIRTQTPDEKSLLELANRVESVARHLLSEATSVDDRLAGSGPFHRMLSVLVCGWLMAIQEQEAERRLHVGEGDPSFLKAKRDTARFHINQIVPYAAGLEAAAMAKADILYALDDRALSG